MGRPTVTAHAGCMDTPMDSLASVTAGVRAGADICEVDVAINGSGVPVLKHNDVLPGESGLTPLSAALEFMRDTPVKLNLDIKVFEACGMAAQMAGELGLQHRVFFTGLYKEDVKRLMDADCGIPYYLNYNIPPEADEEFAHLAEVITFALRCGCVGINSRYGNITPGVVSMLHGAGLLISAWTVDDEDSMRELLQMGVDNITTRRPDVLVKLR